MTTGSIIVLSIIIALVALSIFLLVRGSRRRNMCCGCSSKSCSCCSTKPLSIEDKEN
ncbi:MAG: hypothetical protein IJT54_08195 [Candidatus Methanomethylophilaceae archaeon]|nr:hypothetical protein [Candidatus Methanomethylophilaceae archaeon]